MKEKYIKPTCEIILLPEEEFFTTSGDEKAISKIFSLGSEMEIDAPTVKGSGFWTGNNGNGYFD